jgi:hypothetical protein
MNRRTTLGLPSAPSLPSCHGLVRGQPDSKGALISSMAAMIPHGRHRPLCLQRRHLLMNNYEYFSPALTHIFNITTTSHHAIWRRGIALSHAEGACIVGISQRLQRYRDWSTTSLESIFPAQGLKALSLYHLDSSKDY